MALVIITIFLNHICASVQVEPHALTRNTKYLQNICKKKKMLCNSITADISLLKSTSSRYLIRGRIFVRGTSHRTTFLITKQLKHPEVSACARSFHCSAYLVGLPSKPKLAKSFESTKPCFRYLSICDVALFG